MASLSLHLTCASHTGSTGYYLFDPNAHPAVLVIIYLNIPSIDLRAPAVPEVDFGLFLSGKPGFSLPGIDLSNTTMYGRVTIKLSQPVQLSLALGFYGSITVNFGATVPFVTIISNCGFSGSGTITESVPPVPSITQFGATGAVQICSKLSSGGCDTTNYVGGSFAFNVDVTNLANSVFAGSLSSFISLDKLASIFVGHAAAGRVPNFLAGTGFGPAQFSLSSHAIAASGVASCPFLFPSGGVSANGNLAVTLDGPPNFLLSMKLPALNLNHIITIQNTATDPSGPYLYVSLASSPTALSFAANVSGYISIFNGYVTGSAALTMVAGSSLVPPSTSNQFAFSVDTCVANTLQVCVSANAQLAASIQPSLTAPLTLSQASFSASGVMLVGDVRTALAGALSSGLSSALSALQPLNASLSILSTAWSAPLLAVRQGAAVALRGVIAVACLAVQEVSSLVNYALLAGLDCIAYANSLDLSAGPPSWAASAQGLCNSISTSICSPCPYRECPHKCAASPCSPNT